MSDLSSPRVSNDGTRAAVHRRERRFRGAIAATIVLAAVGLVTFDGTVLLAATIPLVYLAVDALARAPDASAIEAERRIEPAVAAPGRSVRVTLWVKNAGDRTLPDVRVADGVPPELAVHGGTPRAGGSLEPGSTLRLEYALVARRGEYDFAEPTIRLRGVTPGVSTTTAVRAAGEDALECRLDADSPPVTPEGDRRAGALTTDLPGRGVEFHSIRKYHPDDPADRIAWRHYAKHGRLATINYERDLAASIVLAIDARAENHVVAGPGYPTAVELAAHAAVHALDGLLDRGHAVGVAVLGLDGSGPDGLEWLPPGGGREQRIRARRLLLRAAESDPAPVPSRPDPDSSTDRNVNVTQDSTHRRDRTTDRNSTTVSGAEADRSGRSGMRHRDTSQRSGRQARRLLETLPAGTQIALFSPLLDDDSVSAVRLWRSTDVPVVVLSPDVVAGNTVSGQFEGVARRLRLAACQDRGATVVDWRRGTPLPAVLDRAFVAAARLGSNGTGRIPAGGDR